MVIRNDDKNDDKNVKRNAYDGILFFREDIRGIDLPCKTLKLAIMKESMYELLVCTLLQNRIKSIKSKTTISLIYRRNTVAMML